MSEPAAGAPMRSCSSSILALVLMLLCCAVLKRLRHNADVRDTRLFHRIHHRKTRVTRFNHDGKEGRGGRENAAAAERFPCSQFA